MIKIKNPNYQDANALRLAKYIAEIDAYIAGLDNTRGEFLTVDEIIADVLAMNLPGITVADVTVPKIISIAQAYGLELVNV